MPLSYCCIYFSEVIYFNHLYYINIKCDIKLRANKILKILKIIGPKLNRYFFGNLEFY